MYIYGIYVPYRGRICSPNGGYNRGHNLRRNIVAVADSGLWQNSLKSRRNPGYQPWRHDKSPRIFFGKENAIGLRM